MGILVSRKRVGACNAVLWDATLSQYRCGAMVAPSEVLKASLPRGLRWSARLLAPMLQRLALRWIAVGIGCDSTLEVQPADSTTIPNSNSSNASAPRCDKSKT